MGVSSIQPRQENIEPHKRSKRAAAAMVLLRRVKSLGRRSATESPHFTKTGKTHPATPTRCKKTVSVTLPDPPPFEMLGGAAFDGIPHVVTFRAPAEQDELSQVSLEKTLRDMAIIERPLTPIPTNKKGFSNKVRCHILAPVEIVAGEDEWPSDEENEMDAKLSSTSRKSAQSTESPDPTSLFGNICGLPNFFSPAAQQKQARDEREEDDEEDENTANLSSSRDKSLTSSCSSYTASFPIQEGMIIREEGREQRDDVPAQPDPLPSKYRLV